MTVLRRLLSVCFLLLFANAAANASGYLRLNDCYLLYTNPIKPSIDGKGNFMVGLSGFSGVVGAKLRFSSQNSSATMTWRGHTIVFTDNAIKALVDGKPMMMKSSTYYGGLEYTARSSDPGFSPMNGQRRPLRQMIVPVSALIDAFHIKHHWNAKQRIIWLTGKDLTPNTANAEAEFRDKVSVYPPRPVFYSVLLPISFALQNGSFDGSNGNFLSLTVRNLSWHQIRAKQLFIQILMITPTVAPDVKQEIERVVVIDGPYHRAKPDPGPGWPAKDIAVGGTFTDRNNFTTAHGPLDYIVGWLGVLGTRKR